MKPFPSVMSLLQWLSDQGITHPVCVVTAWNPEGEKLRLVKPVHTNNRTRAWLHQRHDQLFFHSFITATREKGAA